jgi:Na+/proline symporter
MPYFVMDKLSEYPGVPGLFVACVFSASLSTLSSGYNALATITWDDFLKHLPISKRLSDHNVKNVCRLLAASYGVLSIFMAFLAGAVGSVLKAAVALSGALFGPLFGLYILGIMCPFANFRGVVIGCFTGQAFTIWCLIGSLMYPAKPVSYPTYIDHCPADRLVYVDEYLANLGNSTLSNAPEEHVGVYAFYHMVFLLVPISGFVISTVVGAIASTLAGGFNNINDVNPNYLSPLCWYIWPASCVPKERRADFDNFDVISTISTEKMANPNTAEDATLTKRKEQGEVEKDIVTSV